MTEEELRQLEKRSALLNSVLTKEAAANSLATCILYLIAEIRRLRAELEQEHGNYINAVDMYGTIRALEARIVRYERLGKFLVAKETPEEKAHWVAEENKIRAAERERCRKIAAHWRLPPGYTGTPYEAVNEVVDQIADAIAALKDEGPK